MKLWQGRRSKFGFDFLSVTEGKVLRASVVVTCHLPRSDATGTGTGTGTQST
jgi:hypothetical protein